MSKPKHPCVYCGNNPVPHLFYYFSESLNIFLTPLRQALIYNPVARFIKRGRISDFLEKLFLALAEKLRIITRQPNPKLCKVRRAQVLWEEAEQRGIVMNELLLFGRPIDTYVAKNSKLKTRNSELVFSGLPRPSGYVNRWLDLMDDKWLFKKLMMKNNLPVPTGASCSNFRQARKIFNEIQNCNSKLATRNSQLATPCILKPRAGSRGRHSTTFVRSEADLKKAFKVAKQLCYWVMVEQQLFGPVYRATIIDGHLAGVLRGDPPFVTGDGQSNIADLITQKNQASRPGVKDIIVDSNCEIFLSRQGLKLTSVLPKGQNINLTEKIGVNYGGSSSEDYDICHPDSKELFIKAAKILGDPIVGFDFIIPDITVSWKNQKCGFIEVNSLPFINLHHDPLLGTPRNAAALVWNMMGW
jgi:D-alanine-D-alanine ligase-like ATP-grasp enzyme